jgi:Uma2 family endonuclease
MISTSMVHPESEGQPVSENTLLFQWQHDNVAPQVVFELLFPSNGTAKLLNEFQFYGRNGVE